MSHVLIERSHSLARHSKVHSGHELGHSWIRAIFMGGQCLSFSTPAECTARPRSYQQGAYLISARALFFCSLNSAVGVLRVCISVQTGRDPFNCCRDRCKQAVPFSPVSAKSRTHRLRQTGRWKPSDALNPTKRYARTSSSSSSSSPCNCRVDEQTRGPNSSKGTVYFRLQSDVARPCNSRVIAA